MGRFNREGGGKERKEKRKNQRVGRGERQSLRMGKRKEREKKEGVTVALQCGGGWRRRGERKSRGKSRR